MEGCVSQNFEKAECPTCTKDRTHELSTCLLHHTYIRKYLQSEAIAEMKALKLHHAKSTSMHGMFLVPY